MDAPKFEKTNHHYVPQHWQRGFRSNGGHLFCREGKSVSIVSTRTTMSQDWLYTVFDEMWRPSDALEDAFSAVEGKDAALFKRLMTPGYVVTAEDHHHLCTVLAMQASRHPDVLQRGTTLSREFGALLASVHEHSESDFLELLAGYGLPPEECENLYLEIKRASADQLVHELAGLLALSPQSSELPMQDAVRAWEKIKKTIVVMEMTFLDAISPIAFILGDTPMPQENLGAGFTIPLSQSLAVKLAPSTAGGYSSINRRIATQLEANETNTWQWENCARLIVGPSRSALMSV